jgi:hypothetical protein
MLRTPTTILSQQATDKGMPQDRGTAATDPDRVFFCGPSLENRDL